MTSQNYGTGKGFGFLFEMGIKRLWQDADRHRCGRDRLPAGENQKGFDCGPHFCRGSLAP